MRTFVALELPDSVKDGILALIEELRGRGVRAGWSRRGTLHLTLKFIGEIDEGLQDDVIGAVRRAAATVPPFRFSVSRLGAFPSASKPRVLWIGVDSGQELFDLARRVDGELASLGFPRERRRFHPHVTLGRIRERRDGTGVAEALQTLGSPGGRVVVRDVRVMKSTLARGGAIHEVLAELPLGADLEETFGGPSRGTST